MHAPTTPEPARDEDWSPLPPAHRDLLLLAFFFFFFLLWASCASSMLEAVGEGLVAGCFCTLQVGEDQVRGSAKIRFAGINTV